MESLMLDYIQSNEIFNIKVDKILLAMSGGKDSMCLAHLFLASKVKFDLIHCNYGLRGEDSEQDEQFIKEFATKFGVKLFCKTMDLKENSKQKSIQEMARNLRYQYFEEIRDANNYQYIATAHHLNDQTETILFNLSRGTGLAGLHGILPKNGKIIRPLLFAQTKDIEQYVFLNKIDFRDDLSNKDLKYSRNLIRHQVVPTLENLQPNLHHNVQHLTEKIRDVEWVMDTLMSDLKEKIFKKRGDRLSVNLKQLESLGKPAFFCYELFKEFGMTDSQLPEFLKFLKAPTGKEFKTGQKIFLKNRTELIIENSIPKIPVNILVKGVPSNYETQFQKICLRKIDIKDYKKKRGEGYLAMDWAKIKGPLNIRNWKEGDKFQPFGMKGQKSVADFLKSKKVDKLEKSKVLVLCAGTLILAVIGFEINDAFKIQNSTKEILILENQKI